MSVYKRGDKYGIGYSQNGKWVRKIVSDSKRMAEQAEREMKRKISRKKWLDIKETKKVHFEILCNEYLQFSSANKTPQSNRRDRVSIKNLMMTFDGMLISEVSARDLEHYKNRRRTEVKPATVNRELSCIKHMYTKAVEWGYISSNPLRSVKKFKEPPGRTRYLTKEEIDRLLRCCAEHIRPIVVMALYTGMRKGELLTLKWQDVDLKNRFITIRQSKNNESRVLRINDMLYKELRSIEPQLPSQYVFAHADGTPYRDIKDGFRAALRRAGIKDFRFHDCRSTYAVHLAMNGTPLLVIQKLLGHKTIAMTVRYSQFSNELLMREAVDKLDFSTYNAGEDHTNTAHLAVVKK